jgi:hypothetical protein
MKYNSQNNTHVYHQKCLDQTEPSGGETSVTHGNTKDKTATPALYKANIQTRRVCVIMWLFAPRRGTMALLARLQNTNVSFQLLEWKLLLAEPFPFSVETSARAPNLVYLASFSVYLTTLG